MASARHSSFENVTVVAVLVTVVDALKVAVEPIEDVADVAAVLLIEVEIEDVSVLETDRDPVELTVE